MPGSSNDSGPIPPSAPSSAPEAGAPVRGAGFPLVLAVAAAASCWNLLGAPFAALTALSALVVALRRLRGAGPARARLVLAAGLAGAALLVSVLVVVAALAAVDPATVLTGAPHPAAAEAERTLDDAERDTASRREAARRELQRLGSPREAIPDAQR